MRHLSILLIMTVLATHSFAQEEFEPFSRKGKILLETGYNLIAGLGSGSGLTITYDPDGETLTSLGFNGGFFVSNNLAIKGRLSLLSTSGGSLTRVSVGPKYYIAGRVPIEIGAGILSGGGASEFLTNASVGIAIPIANNILLEPNVGLLVADTGLFEFGLTFAMIL